MYFLVSFISKYYFLPRLESLKYLDTLKGQVIKTIAVDGIRKWGEIRDALGFTDAQLRPLIKELKSDGLIEEKYDGLWLDYDLWLGYKAYYGDEWAITKLEDLKQEREEKERLLVLREKRKSETHLVRRFQEWIKFKNINIKQKNSHVYLKGDLLDSLVSDLLPRSKKEILIVNPFIEKCSQCDELLTASQRGLDVKIITQSTVKDYEGRRKKAKIKYHKTIKESDIEFYYNESVHAKLIILDDQVLTASSMNLYSESVAGKLWEAGIVTTDLSNINLARESIELLITDPNTKLQV